MNRKLNFRDVQPGNRTLAAMHMPTRKGEGASPPGEDEARSAKMVDKLNFHDCSPDDEKGSKAEARCAEMVHKLNSRDGSPDNKSSFKTSTQWRKSAEIISQTFLCARVRAYLQCLAGCWIHVGPACRQSLVHRLRRIPL
eukprot:6472511-Amphidinium_carterae.1